MKRSNSAFIAVVFLFMLGCTSDKDKLTGTWTVNSVKVNGQEVFEGQKGTFKFEENGNYSVANGEEKASEGKWDVFENDSIMLGVPREEHAQDLRGKYELTDDKLKLKMSDGEDKIQMELTRNK